MKEASLIDKFQLPPKIFITIEVNLRSILDLEEKEVVENLGIIDKELYSNWRYPLNKESYIQKLGRFVYESRQFEGICYPSIRAKKRYNLAIFPDRLQKFSQIKIYDPDKVIEQIIKG